ncbi:MAG: fumarate hydratase [Deltaproteobacteria bacterium]|nr:fumarate hydratase [Deltaproteobacteria bacterium]
MLTQAQIEETVVSLWKKNQFDLPEDFKSSLKQRYESESSEFGKLHLKANIDMVEKASELSIPFCADTGFLAYYVLLGTEAIGVLEGGYHALEETLKRATARVTAEIPLRPNAVHPLTRQNPNNNLGPHSPDIKLKLLSDADFIEITNVAYGGGPELIGSKFTVLSPTAGEKGIRKFVAECAIELIRMGATCSPNVVGVGIGGTFDICALLSKEAAILRRIGDRNPDKELARLEEMILEDLMKLKLGPMGMGGSTSAFDVHAELAYCHMATLPVAVYLQCSAMRRTTARLYAEGRSEILPQSSWLRA